MKIVHIAPELAPIAKVGGLADVVYGLAKEFIRRKEKVTIILPKYVFITQNDRIKNLEMVKDFFCEVPGEKLPIVVWKAKVEDIPIIFIEVKTPSPFFSEIYGGDNERERFLIFAKTATEFLAHSKIKPDVIHLHDWTAAIVAPLLKHKYKLSARIILTMHNLQYQGDCSPDQFEISGLSPSEQMQDPTHPHVINLLKGGIIYADALTTVSPTYAKEIIETKEGHGLQETLKKYNNKLHGILNGIDYHYWNPKTDPFLAFPYPTDDIEKVCKGKKENGAALFQKLSIQQSKENTPLFACITRLVHQKGPELIIHAIRHILAKGGRCILLGSATEPKYMDAFQQLKTDLQGNPNVYLHYMFHESFAHLTFAAADFMLIPSLFEPCGLTQMISMRYGTIPISRKTGGLCDTVIDGQNGLTFQNPAPEEFEKAIDRAFDLYSNRPSDLKKMISQGLQCDFSWEASASKYSEIYQNKLVKK